MSQTPSSPPRERSPEQDNLGRTSRTVSPGFSLPISRKRTRSSTPVNTPSTHSPTPGSHTTSSILPERTFHTEWLFVNGASMLADAWLFADFVGFLKGLGRDQGTVTALNAFPHEAFFQMHPQTPHIAFGFQNSDDDSPVAVFARDEQPLWQMLQPKQAAAAVVLDTLSCLTTRVKAQDTVNIFLIAHGYRNGDFDVAGTRLKLVDLDRKLAEFHDAVNLNLIVKSCYSGHTEEKIRVRGQINRFVQTSAGPREGSFSHTRTALSGSFRGSPFSQASASIFYSSNHHRQIGLADYMSFVSREGESGSSKRVGKPRSWTNADLEQRALDRFFGEYVNVKSPPGKKPRFASVLNESPPLMRPSLDVYHSPSRDLLETVSDILKTESRYVVSVQPPDPADVGFIEQFMRMTRGSDSAHQRLKLCSLILDGARWRFRVQERFLLAWHDLVEHGRLLRTSVDESMDLSASHLSTYTLSDVLQCFQLAIECGPRACENEDVRLSLAGRFDSPTLWLATTILRSHVSVQKIIDYLCTKRFLGSLVTDYRDELGEIELETYAESQAPETSNTQLFFWLPYGLAGAWGQWARVAQTRYNRMKSCYESVKGAGQWGDDTDVQDLFRRYIVGPS